MPEFQSDNEIIQRYKKTGDSALIGTLFTRYTSLVYGVCMKYLKDRDEAKDASMQLFEKLIETLQHHEVENFKSWLYVSARNHCLMNLRAKKGKFKEEISDNLVENDLLLHPPEEDELEEDLARMEECIEKLAEGQQQCVRLFYLEEKCYKDIVTVTKFDMNQVKSFIQNGKKEFEDLHGNKCITGKTILSGTGTAK